LPPSPTSLSLLPLLPSPLLKPRLLLFF
jgi:hypothetical protein